MIITQVEILKLMSSFMPSNISSKKLKPFSVYHEKQDLSCLEVTRYSTVVVLLRILSSVVHIRDLLNLGVAQIQSKWLISICNTELPQCYREPFLSYSELCFIEPQPINMKMHQKNVQMPEKRCKGTPDNKQIYINV